MKRWQNFNVNKTFEIIVCAKTLRAKQLVFLLKWENFPRRDDKVINCTSTNNYEYIPT